ncbi:glycosyltransferase [uncultured Algibacter sp.]|uniref:glycosyltransferase n=1 Tax=uncultured Algibacter sp. TaxID=298659 RepID=UPI0030EC48A8|tara:strand:- start:1996 stop:3012 length:1017 start_codon:yes stop_codon:yes gene_type:complete
MKLSIIIPVYNVEKYIARCLDSLVNQDLAENDYEILVVNDGSRDNSVDIAKKYAIKYANLKVITQINRGVGSARNKGISLAKGKYIYFIDPDDYIAKNSLLLLLDYSERNDLDILTFLSEKTLSPDMLESKTKEKEGLNIKIVTGIEYIANNYYKNEVWWYFIKRDFLKKLGFKFIEGRWMEDAIFTAEIFVKAERVSNVSIDVHRHAVTPQSAMTNKEPSHYLRVIRDNANAAEVFKSIIGSIDTLSPKGNLCIKRLITRQQSFVFFMMIRMLKSTITLKEIKSTLNNLKKVSAYPLNSFISEDYNKTSYAILVKLFNIKPVFYLIFIIFNPILKRL